MYIQEVSHKFNISKKAINLYEEKGLINPQKDNLGYRDYSKETIQQLLKIKQIRNLDFSIQEIKQILKDKNYQIFDKKIQEYQKKYFELDTSLQYISEVKTIIVDGLDIKKISNEMDQTYDLKNLELDENITYPFDVYAYVLLTLAISILVSLRPDDIYTFIAIILWLLAGAISIANIQLYIYKMIKKFKKLFDKP